MVRSNFTAQREMTGSALTYLQGNGRRLLFRSPGGGGHQHARVTVNECDPDTVPAAVWQRCVDASDSVEKIYQSREYLNYLNALIEDPQPAVLLQVSAIANDDFGGLVGLQMGVEELQFRLGPWKLGTLRLNIVRVLGGTPMVAPHHELTALLFTAILERFGDYHAIALQAVADDAPSWQTMQAAGISALRCYLPFGWRQCHTIALPATFEAYLARFSAKKRYNLGRQVKQLEQASGALQLTSVTRPEQVRAMLDVVDAIALDEDRAGIADIAVYQGMAANGLLLCYQLDCGGQPGAVIMGSRKDSVWHVHKIFWNASFARFSIGTSVLHLAIEDLIKRCPLALIDLGYGTPNRDFQTWHVLKSRANVLLYRSAPVMSMLLRLHRCSVVLNELAGACVKRCKRAVKSLKARRKRSPSTN